MTEPNLPSGEGATRRLRLSGRYTARELAVLLEAAEDAARLNRRRLALAQDALRSIARGEWTEKGAQIEASRALDQIRACVFPVGDPQRKKRHV